MLSLDGAGLAGALSAWWMVGGGECRYKSGTCEMGSKRKHEQATVLSGEGAVVVCRADAAYNKLDRDDSSCFTDTPGCAPGRGIPSDARCCAAHPRRRAAIQH